MFDRQAEVVKTASRTRQTPGVGCHFGKWCEEIQFEARSDGEEFDVRLHGRWRSLIVCIGQLTVLVGAMTGLVIASGELGRAAGWW